MAEVIIVEGRSGTGKSRSLIEIPPELSFMITPNSKPLPFKGGDAKWGVGKTKEGADGKAKDISRKRLVKDLESIPKMLEIVDRNPKIKYCIVEDFSHYFHERILSPKFMAQTSGNQAFDRYNVLARDVMDAIFNKAKFMRDDLKIILIHHTDADNSGKERFRIFGKLLGDKLDPVSYTRIVLHTRVIQGKENPAEKYVFQTQDDGVYEAKSPEGLFEEFIPNDLYAALLAIEEYDKESTPKTNEQ